MRSVFARRFANNRFPYIAAPGTPEAILSVCDLGLNLVEKVQCKLSSLSVTSSRSNRRISDCGSCGAGSLTLNPTTPKRVKVVEDHVCGWMNNRRRDGGARVWNT